MLAGRQVLAIVNPSSGRARVEAVEAALDAAARTLDMRLTRRRTEAIEDAGRWAARAADEGFELVLAAGGDGTVGAVAQALIEERSGLPLGVVPVGTGNGLARVLKLPVDAARALEALDAGGVIDLDAMRRVDDGRVALIFFGAGLDAEINRDADAGSKARLGFLAYLLAAARNLRGRRNHRVVLELDGRPETLRAHTVTLFNAASVELVGIDVGPDVDPHDGMLDVAILRNPGLLRSAAAVLRLVSGHRGVGTLRSARRVRLEADPPLLVHADGDVIGHTPLEVELLPAALPVVASQAYLAARREAT